MLWAVSEEGAASSPSLADKSAWQHHMQHHMQHHIQVGQVFATRKVYVWGHTWREAIPFNVDMLGVHVAISCAGPGVVGYRGSGGVEGVELRGDALELRHYALRVCKAIIPTNFISLNNTKPLFSNQLH